MVVEEIKICRSCGSIELKEIISLGNHYVSNFIDSELDHKTRVPLELVLCEEGRGGCGLLQLRHNAPSGEMWGNQYWYKSGINPTIRGDLKDIVENVEGMVFLKDGDIVLDTGCNDGTMLSYYDNQNLEIIGFEPSKNVADEAIKKGHKVIRDFFNKETFKSRFGNKKAKVITSISMFYDLEDPNKFLDDINECLDDDGLFIIQQNYLVKMLENNGLDNICHEHREYYSFRSLKNLIERHNMEIFDVILNGINGGSIRTYIRKRGGRIFAPKGSVERIWEIGEKEFSLGLDTPKPYMDFASRVNSIREKVVNFIRGEKLKGKKICGSGASTKGNTTLQYFGLGPELISRIGDKNPDKFGKMTVGSLIPIDSPEEIDKLDPDYLFVLVWYFIEDIKRNHKDFLDEGGKLIVPLPIPRIISKNGETLL